MSNSKANKKTKIGTVRGLGYALSHNGGMKNIMVQVFNTNTKLQKFIKNVKQ